MKTIYEQLEDELKEVEQPETVEEEVVEEKVDEQPEEVLEEEIPEVEEKPEEVKPSNEDMARLRWENSELKRREREAAEIAARQAIEVTKPKTEEDPEPNKAEDREEWLEWKTRQADKKIAEAEAFIRQQQEAQQKQQLVQGAIQEFQGYEQRFSLQKPDYDQAASFVQKQVKDSIETLNPHLTEAQVNNMLTNQLLSMASNFVNQGLDPAAAIYNMAVKRGYSLQKEEPKTEKAEVKKPSLETIEKNRSKSANGLNQPGGKQPITIASLEKASIKDMYNYTDEEVFSAMYGK